MEREQTNLSFRQIKGQTNRDMLSNRQNPKQVIIVIPQVGISARQLSQFFTALIEAMIGNGIEISAIKLSSGNIPRMAYKMSSE